MSRFDFFRTIGPSHDELASNAAVFDVPPLDAWFKDAEPDPSDTEEADEDELGESVLAPWLTRRSFKQQRQVMSAFRGIDNKGYKHTKRLVHAIRRVSQKATDGKSAHYFGFKDADEMLAYEQGEDVWHPGMYASFPEDVGIPLMGRKDDLSAIADPQDSGTNYKIKNVVKELTHAPVHYYQHLMEALHVIQDEFGGKWADDYERLYGALSAPEQGDDPGGP